MAVGRRVVLLLQNQARLRLLSTSGTLPLCSAFQCLKITPSLTNRTYATPGRPKKAVGEPSKPRKRATTTKAKPAAKPKPAKKKVKAAPKPRAKRVVSEASKARIELAKKKTELKRLKETALLSAPSPYKITSWSAFTAERAKHPGYEVTTGSKELAGEWKAMSESEKKSFSDRAHEVNEQRKADYEKFLAQYTPKQIREANFARKTLRARYPSRSLYRDLKDERRVQGPMNSYAFFVKEYFHENDDLDSKERFKEAGSQWNALDAAQKQKYTDLAAQDRTRYVQEHESVYGFPPKYAQQSASP